MNKKFSTLVASILLAGAVGTVNAQSFVATLPAFDDGATNAKALTTTQYYQLADYSALTSTGDAASKGVLAMLETTPGSGVYELKFVVNADNAPLNNTLWSVSARDNGFGTLLFTFTNKGTGEVLAIDTKDAAKPEAIGLPASALKVGGSVSEWRWYNYTSEDTRTFDGSALLEASFANGDSTVALGFSNKNVVAVKTKNNKAYLGAFTTAELKVTPYTANRIALTARDLNTRLYTTDLESGVNKIDTFNLKFSPEAENNQWKNWFTNQALYAEAAVDPSGATTLHANNAGYNSAVAATLRNNNVQTWVRLKDGNADSKKYIYVDTAFVASENVAYADRHLKFALDTLNSEKVGAVTGVITANYINAMQRRAMFQFVLYPSNDSLAVRAGNADVKKEATDSWREGTTTNNDYSAFTANLATDADEVRAFVNGTQTAAATDAKLVKLVYLTEKTATTKAHSEVTVGAAEGTTVRTKIMLGTNAANVREKTTLASGLYFMNLKSDLAGRITEKDGYRIITLSQDIVWAKEDEAQVLGTIQNFGYMPATQWVVEQASTGKAGEQRVSIYNREYPDIKLLNVQLYKGGDGQFVAPYVTGNILEPADTVSFTAVKTVKPEVKDAYDNQYLGYVTIDSTMLDEKLFNLDYLSGIQMGNYVNVLDSKADTLIRVDLKGEKVNLAIETVPAHAEGYFGYDGQLTTGTNKLFPKLRRTAYNIKVKDSNKLLANYKYVVAVKKSVVGEPMYAISNVEKSDAAKFFLKENNRVAIDEAGDGVQKEVPYYALIEADPVVGDTLWTEGDYRAGIKDGSLLMTQEDMEETRVAAFALTEDNSPLYRRLGVSNPNDGFADMTTDTAKIYRINSTAREYLYEDANSIYSKEKGINFLGVEGKGDAKHSALFVDTAYVRNETNMPQYMFAVDATIVPAGMMCPENPEHNTPEYIANHGDCGHKVQTEGYVMGRYLINAEDSVHLAANGNDYVWNTKYTRLAFVQAKHIGDTLIICRNGKPSTLSADSIFLGNNQHNKITTERPYGIKNPVFALRLINDDPACDFLIESAGNHRIPTDMTGKWVAVKNGVPVVAAYNTYNDAILDAERFNIEKTADTPTANESVSTSNVSVSTVPGAVVIANAAGKTVSIINAVGQKVANTVLSSDSETIEVPAGFVIVTVEGEAAVKAIVK